MIIFSNLNFIFEYKINQIFRTSTRAFLSQKAISHFTDSVVILMKGNLILDC